MVLDANNIAFKNALNIFTDASVINKTISIPAYVAIDGIEYNEIGPFGKALANSTNNEGEVYAIKMALEPCTSSTMLHLMEKRYGGRYINIFSDSKITVYGLREWYNSWIKNMRDGILISSSGQPVANQQIYISIMRLISYYELKVNFYHVSGHVNHSNKQEILKSMEDFKKFNYGISITPQFAMDLAILNDMIDKFSRTIPLDNHLLDIKTNQIFTPIIDQNFDVNKYTSLIQRRI